MDKRKCGNILENNFNSCLIILFLIDISWLLSWIFLKNHLIRLRISKY